ncbi:cell envelope integrity protein TolA [Kluyvera sp. CHPC 1.2972]|uniref:cell envelope integrity protein TolA n=1 Tax=Kluyvera sp. CHPC 1.2972 TaxID=2995176 RepID=UPI002FD81A87
MHKHCGMALGIFIIAGCSVHSKPAVTGPASTTQAPKSIMEYVVAARSAVQESFFEVDKYKGQSCQVDVEQPVGGKIKAVNIKTGDLPLCRAAAAAINLSAKNGKFPDKPEGLPESIPFDFIL